MYGSVPKPLFCNMQGFQTILVLNVCQSSKGTCFNQYQYSMYVSVPMAPISIMQGFQTKLVLNVCQCSKGTHQYHARVSSNISTQYMSVFQRHSSVTCKGFKQYQYSMYVSVPKALISNMLGFQTLLLLNVCQCCKGTHQYHARVSNYISTQCMSSVPKATHQYHCKCFKTILVLNVCQCFQRHSLVQCKATKQILVLNVCQCSKGTHQ